MARDHDPTQQIVLQTKEGVKVWVGEFSSVHKALFLPGGALDFPDWLTSIDPPPPTRVRLAYVNNELLLIDSTGTPVVAITADVDEVVLTFPDTVAPGVAINVQDGTYGGGGPATVEGDTITLPGTGALFKSDGKWLVFLNGQQLKRGDSLADEEVNWSSSTQVSLASRIRPGNELTIRKVK